MVDEARGPDDGARGPDDGDDASSGRSGGSDAEPPTMPLRRCTAADHDGSVWSRAGACGITLLGVVFVAVGVVGLVAQVIVLDAVGWIPAAVAEAVREPVGFVPAFGIFLTGFALLGRRSLVDRLVGLVV
jgi:hypothetical protein